MTPDVSVIMPVFNRVQYVSDAVESVFAQSFTDWELIIVDDGSDEHTRSLLRKFQTRPAVKVIWRAHTGNPAAARNAGLDEARGTYVAFLDSDDFWMQRKLELQVAAMRANPECQWSYTALTRVDKSGKPLVALGPTRFVPHKGRIVEQLLRWEACVATPTVIAERRLVEACESFDERQGQHEDYDLWLRLAMRSNVFVLSQALACVRNHDEHYSVNGLAALRAKRRLIEKMQGLITEPSESEALLAELTKNAAALAIANSAARDGRAAWRILAASRRVSWRRSAWWWGAAKALIRYFVPASWLVALRRHSHS